MAGRGGSTNEGFVDSDSNVINHSRFDAKDIDDDPRDSSNDVEDPETRWRPNSTTSSSRKYVPKPNNNNISDEMDMQEISIKPDGNTINILFAAYCYHVYSDCMIPGVFPFSRFI